MIDFDFSDPQPLESECGHWTRHHPKYPIGILNFDIGTEVANILRPSLILEYNTQRRPKQ